MKKIFKKIKSLFKSRNLKPYKRDELDSLKPHNNSYIINYRIIKYKRGLID